ncbi:hypothetical protein NDU88_012515 [Pleurodeles waltl]|uniref:Uncharacterized protein n=1 Tax=Pleurodeles waltl TaxID=8319 RepID=A0AAV7R1V0_PLEWA|nr:hypothetical protein NDU88_012515 [Pleurodeles waltl]
MVEAGQAWGSRGRRPAAGEEKGGEPSNTGIGRRPRPSMGRALPLVLGRVRECAPPGTGPRHPFWAGRTLSLPTLGRVHQGTVLVHCRQSAPGHSPCPLQAQCRLNQGTVLARTAPSAVFLVRTQPYVPPSLAGKTFCPSRPGLCWALPVQPLPKLVSWPRPATNTGQRQDISSEGLQTHTSRAPTFHCRSEGSKPGGTAVQAALRDNRAVTLADLQPRPLGGRRACAPVLVPVADGNPPNKGVGGVCGPPDSHGRCAVGEGAASSPAFTGSPPFGGCSLGSDAGPGTQLSSGRDEDAGHEGWKRCWDALAQLWDASPRPLVLY